MKLLGTAIRRRQLALVRRAETIHGRVAHRVFRAVELEVQAIEGGVGHFRAATAAAAAAVFIGVGGTAGDERQAQGEHRNESAETRALEKPHELPPEFGSPEKSLIGG